MARLEASVQYHLDLARLQMLNAAAPRYAVGVSLTQVEYFVAVAEEGHVGRAANKLHVAQPAVSRQIRRLEDELRAPLFMRTPRGMRLSQAGAIFLRHAREILNGVEAARIAVERASMAPRTSSNSAVGADLI
jgi:DNA-binding transcriptional LysR family regulator